MLGTNAESHSGPVPAYTSLQSLQQPDATNGGDDTTATLNHEVAQASRPAQRMAS